MIPLAIPNLCGNEGKYLLECVDTNFVSSVGPFVDRFERMAADAAGAKYGVATASGTAGLQLALATLGIGRDDLVITPSYTFVATVNSIVHSGAEPWLFDVDQNSWCLNPIQVEEKIRSECARENGKLIHSKTGKRIAAVMAVYMNGAPADMDHFQALAREFNLPLIADAAAAVGAKYDDQSLASVADLTVFSFNGNKIVTSGGGGAIVTNDEGLAKRAKHLCSTARVGVDYTHDAVGFNYRMTNIEAAVGCAQLENLQSFLYKKRAIQSRYNQELLEAGLGIKALPANKHGGTYWLSGVILPEANISVIVQKLSDRGVTARPFWKPVHLQIPYASFLRTQMPVCESVWKHVLTLPCSTQLTAEEQTKVIQDLIAVLKDAE